MQHTVMATTHRHEKRPWTQKQHTSTGHQYVHSHQPRVVYRSKEISVMECFLLYKK